MRPAVAELSEQRRRAALRVALQGLVQVASHLGVGQGGPAARGCVLLLGEQAGKQFAERRTRGLSTVERREGQPGEPRVQRRPGAADQALQPGVARKKMLAQPLQVARSRRDHGQLVGVGKAAQAFPEVIGDGAEVDRGGDDEERRPGVRRGEFGDGPRAARRRPLPLREQPPPRPRNLARWPALAVQRDRVGLAPVERRRVGPDLTGQGQQAVARRADPDPDGRRPGPPEASIRMMFQESPAYSASAGTDSSRDERRRPSQAGALARADRRAPSRASGRPAPGGFSASCR